MSHPGASLELRQLRRAELILGQRLPSHVYDRNGRILIRRGLILKPEHLALIDERDDWDVFTDPSWPDAAARSDESWAPPDELMQMLKRRMRMRRDRGNFRRQPRYLCRVRVTVLLQEKWKSGIQWRELKVTTCDVGPGGFSFVCDRYVHLGTIVFPRFESLPNRPVMKGIVRNCTYVEGRDHRVGVQFLKLQAGELPRRI